MKINYGPGLQQLGQATQRWSDVLASMSADMYARNQAEIDQQYRTDAAMAQLKIEGYASEWMSNPANLVDPNAGENLKKAVNQYWESNKAFLFNQPAHIEQFSQNAEYLSEALSIRAMEGANKALKEQSVEKSTRLIEELASTPDYDFAKARTQIIAELDSIERNTVLKDREGTEKQAIGKLFDTWFGTQVNALVMDGESEDTIKNLIDGVSSGSYSGRLGDLFAQATENLGGEAYSSDRSAALKKSVEKVVDERDKNIRAQVEEAVEVSFAEGRYFDTSVMQEAYNSTADRNRLAFRRIWIKADNNNDSIYATTIEDMIKDGSHVPLSDINRIKNASLRSRLRKESTENLLNGGQTATIQTTEKDAASAVIGVAVSNAVESNYSDEAMDDLFESFVQASEPLGLASQSVAINPTITYEPFEVVKNADGTVSTVDTISIEEDGLEVLIPTIVDGSRMTENEAINRYKGTGLHFGKYESIDEANAAASALHGKEEERLAQGGDVSSVVSSVISKALDATPKVIPKIPITSDMSMDDKVNAALSNMMVGHKLTDADKRALPPDARAAITQEANKMREGGGYDDPDVVAALEASQQDVVTPQANQKRLAELALAGGQISFDTFSRVRDKQNPTAAEKVYDAVTSVVKADAMQKDALVQFANERVAANPGIATDDNQLRAFVADLTALAVKRSGGDVLRKATKAARFADKGKVVNPAVGQFLKDMEAGEFDHIIMWELFPEMIAGSTGKTDAELLDIVSQRYTGMDYSDLPYKWEKNAVEITAKAMKAAGVHATSLEKSFGLSTVPVFDSSRRQWVYQDPTYKNVFFVPENHGIAEEGGADGISWRMFVSSTDNIADRSSEVSLAEFVNSGLLDPGENYVSLSLIKDKDKLTAKIGDMEGEVEQIEERQAEGYQDIDKRMLLSGIQKMTPRQKQKAGWTDEKIKALEDSIESTMTTSATTLIQKKVVDTSRSAHLKESSEAASGQLERSLMVLAIVNELREQLSKGTL